jgi:hypothetical protein
VPRPNARRFDNARAVEHSKDPMTLFHRALAAALGLILLGGNAVVCTGWAATPEARMACCSDGECPMHMGESSTSGSEGVRTQSQADACCAVSESTQSSRPSPTFMAAISSAELESRVAVLNSSPRFAANDGWRTTAPIALAPVPRHVLLSVFLV